jgi:multiple sugar transport system substrate-binding protein
MSIIELKGMTWEHARGLDCLVQSNDLLMQKCGISINWDSRSLQAFGDQHVSEFYSDYDLMVIDHPHLPDAVHADAVIAFEELTTRSQLDFLESTSVGASHDSYQYQGKQWALAIDTAAQVSAFRPDKAERSPVFWYEVFELAKEKKLLWAHKPVDAFSTFATLMAQKGQPLQGNASYIDHEMALEVLQFMVELASLVPDFCASSNPIEIAEVLSGTDEYTYGVCIYGYSNYSRVGFRKNVLVYDDIPSFDGRATGSQLGGAGIAVSARSNNPKAAAEAALLLSMPEIQSTTYGLGGGQPGNLLAWKNELLNVASHNFFRNTLRTLENAWVRPRVLGWPDVQYQSSLIIHKCLVEKVATRKDVEEIGSLYQRYVKE